MTDLYYQSWEWVEIQKEMHEEENAPDIMDEFNTPTTMKNYIEPIKKELEENLHQFCQAYMLIGNGTSETPRFFNIQNYDVFKHTLTIGSTQKQSLNFTIDLNNKFDEYVNFNDFWQQFKEFRTNFLLENYPTIDTQ